MLQDLFPLSHIGTFTSDPLREPAHPHILGRSFPAKQRACSAACVLGSGAAMIQAGVIAGREE